MGTVTTSTVATATAFGNQRKIDRCQNGVLVELNESTNGSYRISLSTDATTTWTSASNEGYGGASYVANGSIFVDLDDNIHRVYKDANDGYIKYMRGVPTNAARTAYTWSAATVVVSSTVADYPDLIAHRDPATPGAWITGIVASRHDSTSTDGVIAFQVNISAAGAATVTEVTPSGPALGNTAPKYPSIDFNHTGDGKTVAGGTPHWYIGYSAGATGSGKGIRFRKRMYASGSWTWGTEREIDNTRYIDAPNRWLNCLYDGTRVILVGTLITSSSINGDVVLYDRDASDPATGGTTARVLIADATSPNTGVLMFGSSTYDSAGNVYFFGRDQSGSAGTYKVNSRRWVRSTATLDALTTFDTSGSGAPYVSVRRGPQGQAIDYVYTDGTASPYTVTSGRIVLNQNPTAPTPLTPADSATWDSSTDQTVTFKPNDPDGDGASKVRVRFRPAGTSVAYAYLESTTAVAAGGTASVLVPANTWDGVIEWAAQSYDPAGAEGAWSVTRTAVGVPAALAALTGGQGGTSVTVHGMVNMTQSERAMRALSLV